MRALPKSEKGFEQTNRLAHNTVFADKGCVGPSAFGPLGFKDGGSEVSNDVALLLAPANEHSPSHFFYPFASQLRIHGEHPLRDVIYLGDKDERFIFNNDGSTMTVL